jgi:hypothetical protein
MQLMLPTRVLLLSLGARCCRTYTRAATAIAAALLLSRPSTRPHLLLWYACACCRVRFASHTRRDHLCLHQLLASAYRTLATHICYNIRLKQMKRLEHTLATYVYGHFNICNIQMKHLQHTFETTETFETYTYNIYVYDHYSICNIQIKHLEHMFEIAETFENIHLQHTCIASATYATSR